MELKDEKREKGFSGGTRGTIQYHVMLYGLQVGKGKVRVHTECRLGEGDSPKWQVRFFSLLPTPDKPVKTIQERVKCLVA